MLRKWAIFDRLSSEQLGRIKHIHVFEGGRSALFITSGDIVYALGTNGPYNLLGLSGRQKNYLVMEPENVERLSLKSIYTMAVGDHFGVANNTNGELYHWGRRMDKKRGILLPHQVKCPYFVTDLACGSEFFVILTNEQKVFFRGSFQQNDQPITEFTEVSLPSGVSYVSCGVFHLALLGTDGQVYTCGYDHNTTFRSWKSEDGHIPKKIELKEQCVQVVCGRRSTVCVLASGTVWASGENDNLGVESENSVMKTPARVKIAESIREMAATWYSNIYVACAWSGRIYVWGHKTRWPTVLKDASVMLDAFRNKETPSSLGMIPVAPQLTPCASFNEKSAVNVPSVPLSYTVMERLERSLSVDDLSVSKYAVREEASSETLEGRNCNDGETEKAGRSRSGTQTMGKPKNLPPGLGLLISASKYLATRPSDRQTNRRRALSPEAHPAKVPQPTFSVAAGSAAALTSSVNNVSTNLSRDRSQSMENLDSRDPSRSKKKPRVLSVIFGFNNSFDTTKTPPTTPQTGTPTPDRSPPTPGYLMPVSSSRNAPFYPEIPPIKEDGPEKKSQNTGIAEDKVLNASHSNNPFIYDPMSALEFQFPKEAAQSFVEKTKNSENNEQNVSNTKALLEYYTVLADIKSHMSELNEIVHQLADIIFEL